MIKQKKKDTEQRYSRKNLRREDIVNKTRPIFAKKGYRETSIEDILRACNIAQGTLYLHFNGKKEVFREILIDGYSRFQKILRPISIDDMKEKPDEVFNLFNYIKRKNRSFFESVSEEKELFKLLLFESSGLDQEINQIIKNFFFMIQNQVEVEMTMLKAMGELNDVDIKLAVQMT
jgi:AcrR family transcriptional regulator